MLGAKPAHAVRLLVVAAALLAAAPASALDTRAAVDELAAQLERFMPPDGQVRLAVTDCSDPQGVVSDYGRFVADRLIARLARNLRLMPVERRFFEELLKQIGLRGADLSRPESARRLRRAYPVDLLVPCRLAELGQLINLEARVIDLSTFDLLGVATSNVDKDPRLQRFLESGRE
jgi:hypothetical protein